MTTAEKAREIAKAVKEVPHIIEKILKEAKKGEPGLHVLGCLSYPAISKLRDELGYKISYDSEKELTWIWWGNT